MAAALKRCRAISGNGDDLAAMRLQGAKAEVVNPEVIKAGRRSMPLRAALADNNAGESDDSDDSLVDMKERLEEEEEAPLVDGEDGDRELERQCRRLAELIAGSRHLVAFTGAGISTSVGIPDYRGENGIRTKRMQDKARKRQKTEAEAAEEDGQGQGQGQQAETVPDFHSLVPSPTHMALAELFRLGYLKHIVSQNVDNLHLKSGIPPAALTEVHGNATQAKCETCEKVYTRDFPWTGLCDDPACVSTKRPVEQRLRARTRHGNGRLKRNVVGFDEPLGDIDLAIDECEAADVALVLGTSLRVEPFSEMAGEYGEALIIVNLQATTQKLDRRAAATGVRLFDKCDVVMAKTMKYLVGDSDYEIPRWDGEHPTEVFVPEHEDKNLVNVLAGRLFS